MLFVIIFLVVAVNIFNAITSGPRQNLERIVARTDSLQKFTADNQSAISDTDLAKLNSEATIFLASNTFELKTKLKEQYNAEVSEPIKLEEADTTSKETLKDATSAGRFNESYRQLLNEKLATALQLAKSIQQNSTSQSLNNVLQQTIANLEALAAQL